MPPNERETSGRPAASGPDLPWSRERRLLLLGGAALVVTLLVVGGTLVLRDDPAPGTGSDPSPGAVPDAEPARVVAEFLTALADQDPQRAMAVAGVAEPPTGDRALFLRPEAMSDQWRIREIAPVDPVDLTDGRVLVDVAVMGPAGETTFTIHTRRDAEERWVIPEPFGTVEFLRSPLWYVDLNGHRAPAGADQFGQGYLLLPGFYKPYPVLPSGIEAGFEARFVTPGAAWSVVPAGVTLTDGGERAIQQAVEDYVDACVGSTDSLPHACPFGAEAYSELPGYSIFWDFEPVEWTVLSYPLIAAAPSDSSLLIADRRRGEVELRATVDGVEVYDGRLEHTPPEPGSVVEVVCEMDTSDLEAGFTATGEVAVTVGYQRYAYPDLFPAGDTSPHTTETCHHVSPAGG